MFSHQKQEISDIFTYYDTSRASLNYYRKNIEENRIIDDKYIGCTKQELIQIFQNYLEELEKNVCLNILNAIEADFRTDYLIRVRKRHKSLLSRKFRELYKAKEQRVSLEQDILAIWKQENQNLKSILSDYTGALKYRHWLAHGRYWNPKLGRTYDLLTISLIAQRIYENIPLIKS